ncbi:MAG: iron uptake protein [Burkholderiales bacterium]|nr:iron uptake protein [Burkholderiales bacterium]
MLSRIVAALLGGYVFCWGFAALGMAIQSAFDINFHDAEHGMMLVVFLVYLGVFLWAFVAKSLRRVWAVLAGGGALMTAAAWAIQRALT